MSTPLLSTCPECAETRKLRLTVSPTSERFPLPVFRFECKVCGCRWVQDENRAEGEDAPSGKHIH